MVADFIDALQALQEQRAADRAVKEADEAHARSGERLRMLRAQVEEQTARIDKLQLEADAARTKSAAIAATLAEGPGSTESSAESGHEGAIGGSGAAPMRVD